ncbi:hypothetical protein CPB85DRAFT_227165 [Mucidula mucida]|nr:hypothetical protein CPB85DRAFT_227165 [Mucidula mucida]
MLPFLFICCILVSPVPMLQRKTHSNSTASGNLCIIVFKAFRKKRKRARKFCVLPPWERENKVSLGPKPELELASCDGDP